MQVSLPSQLVSLRSKITNDIGYLPPLTHTTFTYDFDHSVTSDLLDLGLFMVSDKIKAVFDTVLPHLEYRKFCVTSHKTQMIYFYYAPILPHSDFTFERMDLEDRDNVHTIKIFTGDPLEKDILKLKDSNRTYVLVSLLIAEKLLRIGTQNIRLLPVEVVRQG